MWDSNFGSSPSFLDAARRSDQPNSGERKKRGEKTIPKIKFSPSRCRLTFFFNGIVVVIKTYYNFPTKFLII
jgi:hypothetical protein